MYEHRQRGHRVTLDGELVPCRAPSVPPRSEGDQHCQRFPGLLPFRAAQAMAKSAGVCLCQTVGEVLNYDGVLDEDATQPKAAGVKGDSGAWRCVEVMPYVIRALQRAILQPLETVQP